MKHLLNFILFISLSSPLFAQNSASFNGEYTINKSKTEFWDAPQWVVPAKFKVVASGDHIAITRTMADASGATNSIAEQLVFNGPVSQTTLSSGLVRKASIAWNADKKSFVINSNSINADHSDGSILVETWSLENDGKTLVVNRDMEQADGLKYTIKAYYDRL